ncbi:uncharacterized protein LOC126968378 isoform X2 [Leptidea sinapis]|uniref:uncharacterized protein LOC126968378 isoform X2 n=1 Tax=Leptidea sinapis TaxID=189913 RepID=UPI0021C426EE|nr:uncharacterized protein LOC126968378 isoform X2 [Leptidea sinapis]
MAGSRERLLYDRSDYYEYERRKTYERHRPEVRNERFERIDRPRRKNGYVYEDIYSDFDEAQGRLSLFRPIRPEYLNLQSTYPKYNSLPRNYYNERRYKKDYYDFRIRENRYESTERNVRVIRPSELKVSKPKNVAVCKPLRISDNNVQYWTTDIPKERKKRDEPKKIVKFSEVSGCQKTVVDDPICGKKTVAARELEVSLDQMIQNGYFEKHNIPILKVDRRPEVPRSIPNGKCATVNKAPPPRSTTHLPQVIAALAVSLAPFSAGLGKGYSSPAIASLQGPGNSTRRDFQLTDQQASWLASLSLLGALFGGMAGGAAMRHGRRRVLSLAAAPCSLSWLLTVVATSVRMMCITAFLGGFCCSILTMLSQHDAD